MAHIGQAEDGIPLPKVGAAPLRGLAAKIRALNVGQSIYVEGITDRRKVSNAAWKTAMKAGVKLATRAEGNGVRIWRFD